MVQELSEKVPAFGGATTHTHFFLHTINLVAKSLIWEFDIKKCDADQALAEADNVDDEESEDEEEVDDSDTADAELKDNDEGWVNEVELLEPDEQKVLEREIQPMKLTLVKVGKKNPLTWILNICVSSCKSWPTESSTQQLLYSPHGIRFFKIRTSLWHWCHVTWQLGGIPPLTCWIMHLSIGKLLTMWHNVAIWVCESMS